MYLGYEAPVSTENDKKAKEILDSLLKSNSNSNPNINPNKEEMTDDSSDFAETLAKKMDEFLIKLPTIRTQEDGFVNTSKGDFGFPQELVVCFDENGQEVAAPVDDNAAFISNNSNEYMEME